MPPNLPYRDPYASQRGGPSELAQLWAKYKPTVAAHVNDLNTKAGEHLATLRQSVAERKRGEGYGPATAEMLEQLANAYNPSALGVIKGVGGNWLSGSVEDSLKGLKRTVSGKDPVRQAELVRRDLSQLGSGIDPSTGVDLDVARRHYQRELDSMLPEATLNSWIDKQLTRYVKNDMATERDPVRALAERGILHVNPEQLNFRLETHGKYMEPGQTAVAQSPMAKAWEGASDLKIHGELRAGDFLSDTGEWLPENMVNGRTTLDNPWLAKVPPDTPVHAIAEQRALPADLGFNHLMDEMRNMLNPESGLPPELLMKYSSLNNVSVPQMVERVAKVNEWREAQKIAANQALANNAATVLHKDYPEKGFKWVQLKQGDLPEGWSRLDDDPTWTRNPKGELTEEDPARRTLQDALKYEGDTMGHCVGRYCSDVASGKSSIFSLRDAKGQPHATIEVKPSLFGTKQINALSPEEKAVFTKAGAEMARAGKRDNADISALYSQLFPESEWAKGESRIVQIKGKGNRKPNDEYLPFVQDFVKSGKWSDVGELQNSGMRRTRDALNDLEQKTLRDKGQTFGDYLTDDELEALQAQWEANKGFSEGGLVHAYNPEAVNTLASQLLDELKAQHGN